MPWGTGCVYQDWEVLNLPALTSRHHPVEWGTDQDVSPGVDLFYFVFAPITLYALLPWNPPSTVTRCCLVVLWLPSGRPPSFWCLCSSCSSQPSPSPLPHCLPLIGLLGFWSIIPCSCDPGYIDGYDTKRCNPPYPTLYSNALCARSILNGFVLIYFLTKKSWWPRVHSPVHGVSDWRIRWSLRTWRHFLLPCYSTSNCTYDSADSIKCLFFSQTICLCDVMRWGVASWPNAILRFIHSGTSIIS